MSRRRPRGEPISAEERGLPEPILLAASLSAPLALQALFGRRAPVELEIGIGKGRFLVTEAAGRPGHDFLGIDYTLPYVRLVRERILAAGLRNVRLLHSEATDALARLVPPGSLRAVHVLFPDPWPKRRHRGRRLLVPERLELVTRALEPGGVVNVATDHTGYAAAILEAFAAVPALEPLAEPALGGDLAARSHYAAKTAARGADLFLRSWRRRE